MLSLKEELEIFIEEYKIIKARFPFFQMRIICCGLKIIGKEHIQKQLDAIMEADKYTNMVAGFDMVCEEDYNMPTDEFLEQIYTTKMKMGDKFNLYMHAGESY